MKIDLGSWAVRLSIDDGSATPGWGTALGQGKGYLYSFSDQDKYFWAMDKCAVDTNNVSCPMGKGGNQYNRYGIIRAALFNNVIIHKDDIKIPLSGAHFILIELEQQKGYHTGRKIIKYGPKNKYIVSDNALTNEKCFELIEQKLTISQDDGWFVSSIEFEKGNDLHIYVHVIKGKTSFPNGMVRKEAMRKELKGFVSHYTSLDAAISLFKGVKNDNLIFRATRSDCLNDPNECRYGADMCKRIFHSTSQPNYPYILSFCKTSDSPIMWRLYESKIQLTFNRYELETKIEQISNSKVSLKHGDVLYNDLRNISTQTEFKDKTGISLTSSNRNYYISLLKHIDYMVENEWRIIATETGAYDLPEKRNDIEQGIVGATSAFGLIKLYREISIPATSLKEIIVYEFDDEKYNLIKSQIENLLNRNNITGIKIKKTECAGVRSK